MPHDRLQKYRAKRDPSRTAEPFSPGPASAGGLFVVHQHGARHLHFDLRLELDGVLLSWAVPRGPSLDPAEKRMAIHVEDHPIAYGDFEGQIPGGNYGAGGVIVWDRGRWIPIEDPVAGMVSGKLLFDLVGYKLRGRWTLVRTKKAPNQWLLIKKPDAAAHLPAPSDASVLSGLTLDELAQGAARAQAMARELAQRGARTGDVDASKLPPMLAETAQEPFDDPGWLYELKYDGYRLVADKRGNDVTLRYRSGRDVTRVFPEIARAVAAWPCTRALVDGEVVVLDEDAKPSFRRLQPRAALERAADVARASVLEPVTYYAFDLLALEELDLRALPLEARKAVLARLVPGAGPVRYADHVDGAGTALYRQVEALGLEGIIAKDRTSPYRAGRSDRWLKVRTEITHDFVVVGYNPPEKAGRVGFSALHLAVVRPEGLTYAGRVGTGFDTRTLTSIRALLEPRRTDGPPCSGPLPSPPEKASVWVRPELVAEVRFLEWTEDGIVRFPVFLRLRDDKRPEECLDPRLDAPAHADEAAPPAPPTTTAPSGTERAPLTNGKKLFWPEDGFTKKDLYTYYEAISPWLLPYLRDRPMVVVRYPDGVAGKSFFQKDAPAHAPDWLRTERMWSEEANRELDHFVPDDLDGLRYLANLGAIPFHMWASRVGAREAPDWCVIDLDPKGAPFTQVVEVALRVRALCDDLGVACYPKTSGATGMHVLIPLGARYTYAQCRALAELLARIVAAEAPELATVERRVEARGGRVYLDFVQNGPGKLIVAPFSARPVKGARVSMPLEWREVDAGLDPARYTIITAVERMQALGHDPLRPVLGGGIDLEATLARVSARL